MKNNPVIYCCLLAVVALGYSALADRAIYVVPTNASPISPFLNWTNAATNLIDAANVATNGDTVYVTNGAYQLANQVVVRQGVRFQSIHDGDVDPGGTVVIGSGAHRCFYLYTNVFLAGFTIINGKVTGATYGDTGGGIYTDPGTTISNCIITGNTVSNAGIGSGGGIGMYYLLSDARTVTVIRCTISGNLAWSDINNNRGGGGAQFWSPCVIQDSTVSLNQARSYGGGLHLGGKSVVTRCVISANKLLPEQVGASGGGVYYLSGTVDHLMTESTVAYNTNAQASTSRAGGIYFHGGGALRNCVVRGNSSANIGGGLSILATAVVVSNTLIEGNIAVNYGGGVDMRYGLLVNCQVKGNTAAGNGGGLTRDTGAANIRNCLLLNNVAGGSGGGLYINGSGYNNVSACTIVSNYSTTGGGLYYNMGGGSPSSFSNCIIYGNLSSYYDHYDASLASASYTNDFYYSCGSFPNRPLPPAQGNIAANPQFVGSVATNYRLKSNSPCRNAGTNETWMADAVDLDGHRRIDVFSGRADMGAYEYLQSGSCFYIH